MKEKKENKLQSSVKKNPPKKQQAIKPEQVTILNMKESPSVALLYHPIKSNLKIKNN